MRGSVFVWQSIQMIILVETNIYFPEVSVAKPPKLDSDFVYIVSHRI